MRMRAQTGLVVSLLVVSAAIPAIACIWDSDTIDMERQSFPGVQELITGKFLRHSKEFYEWRIQDREKRLKTDADNMGFYDDLAVAYHKVGQNDKAIATILEKEKRHPGLYETYSNLGTFYIFTGELEKSVVQIAKAIEINPDAHFGREVYQKLLVEYIVEKRAKGQTGESIPLPLRGVEVYPAEGFDTFVQRRLGTVKAVDKHPRLSREERNRAIQGVLGMMRFANYDSPLLLEALGDLLSASAPQKTLNDDDAKQLAARAYLMASYQVQDSPAAGKYHALAQRVLVDQEGLYDSDVDPKLEGVAYVEKKLQMELKEADVWWTQVRGDELSWIKSAANVEEEYARKYFSDPSVANDQTRVRQLPAPSTRVNRRARGTNDGVVLATIVGFAIAAFVSVIVQRRKRREDSPESSASASNLDDKSAGSDAG